MTDHVYSELEGIEVEEVWDRSGSKRDGYIDPGEMAWEMFEEALAPFLLKLKNYQKLTMLNDAKHYCMGILQGIHLFSQDSKSEYKEWAGDAPRENFSIILHDWENSCDNENDLKEMEIFLKKNCSNWRV